MLSGQGVKKFFAARMDLWVLLLCLLTTLIVWKIGIGRDNSQEGWMKEKKEKIEIELKDELGKIFYLIDGLRGLYVASEQVSTDEVSLYLQSTLIPRKPQTLLRISYVEKEDETHWWVKQVTDQSGKIHPPITLNLLDQPGRRELIQKVVASGRAEMVYVEQIVGVPEYQGPTFILGVPVIKDGQVVGLINALISQEKMEKKVEEATGGGVEWEWRAQGGEVFRAMTASKGGVILSEIAKVPLTESDSWEVVIQSVKTPSALWNGLLAGGMLISLMIYLLVYTLASASAKAGQMARALTADLQKYKQALDNATNHVVITDSEGVILYANEAAQKLTGYALSELVGQTPRLWGGQMSRQFYEDFWRQIKIEKKAFIGEITNRRKGGEIYIAHAIVSPILGSEGQLSGFVAIETDITNQKKQEQEKMKNLEEMEKLNQLMVGRELKMVELKKELALLKKRQKKEQ